jgi:hypothetical protein
MGSAPFNSEPPLLRAANGALSLLSRVYASKWHSFDDLAATFRMVYHQPGAHLRDLSKAWFSLLWQLEFDVPKRNGLFRLSFLLGLAIWSFILTPLSACSPT